MKHVEHPRQNKFDILAQHAKNSLPRENFSNRVIFSYHWKQMLWYHIPLNMNVTPKELSVLEKGIFPKEQHRCSCGSTPPSGRKLHLPSGLPTALSETHFCHFFSNAQRAHCSDTRLVEYHTPNLGCSFWSNALSIPHIDRTSLPKWFSSTIEDNCSGSTYC